MRVETSCAAEWAHVPAAGERQGRSVCQPRIGVTEERLPRVEETTASTLSVLARPRGISQCRRRGRRQPWAGRRNAVGVRRCGGNSRTPDAVALTEVLCGFDDGE